MFGPTLKVFVSNRIVDRVMSLQQHSDESNREKETKTNGPVWRAS